MKLTWHWFSQAQGVADIYLTTQVKFGKEFRDYILWTPISKAYSYALAEKVDAEIERLGLELDGIGVRKMMRIYNRERMDGQTARWAAEKAGITPAKMRNGWKKGTTDKLPKGGLRSELLASFGLDFDKILIGDRNER